MQLQTSESWSKWAMRTVANSGIIPLHSKHISRSLKTVEIVMETIDNEYVKNGVKQFFITDFYRIVNRQPNKRTTPGLTSVIGCIRLLSCSGIFTLVENGVSFGEKTAKSISCVTINDQNTYQLRSIPVQLMCINTFCMFAVEHPERLLPKLHKNIAFETLIPFCTVEPIDIDTISTATITIKVICKLCTKLMDLGYLLGFSVRCKDSTSRYGIKFQNTLSKCAIECGTQLRIEKNREKIIEIRKPTKRFIGPITTA